MNGCRWAIGVAIFLSVIGGNAVADDALVLFDVDARKAQLQLADYAPVKAHCLAKDVKQPEKQMPTPVLKLKATEGYGSDTALNNFTWYLMVHAGRALAGHEASQERVQAALMAWAKADALFDTNENHDTYYALKRGLLPIITSYLIVQPELSQSQRNRIEAWIDPLVRRIDKRFNKEVDINNHRYLADAVLTLWGDAIGDEVLYIKGKERFRQVLAQMTSDGGLPLETRRGARALWYMRQSLANLTMIAGIYQRNGDNLYQLADRQRSLPLMMHYFVSGVRYPSIMQADTSENHKPGPSADFLQQDMGMLERRGHGRHYMAFAHLYLADMPEDDPSRMRLQRFMNDTGFKELPLIDEFVGGNATCFWGTP